LPPRSAFAVYGDNAWAAAAVPEVATKTLLVATGTLLVATNLLLVATGTLLVATDLLLVATDTLLVATNLLLVATAGTGLDRFPLGVWAGRWMAEWPASQDNKSTEFCATRKTPFSSPLAGLKPIAGLGQCAAGRASGKPLPVGKRFTLAGKRISFGNIGVAGLSKQRLPSRSAFFV
jgi:hypothetical protein